MEILQEKKRYLSLDYSSSIQHISKKYDMKNKSLMENIQKNNIDSKENKITKNVNNPPRNNTTILSKIKPTKIEEKDNNNSNDLYINQSNNDEKKAQIIGDNIKMLFLNLDKSNNVINSIINSIQIEKKNFFNNIFYSRLNSNSSIDDSNSDYELKYKRADKIRFSYIQKLVSKEFYLPKNNNVKNIYNSLIIFDWDDTLFPTSFLDKSGYFSEKMFLTEKEEKIFQIINKLEKTVIDLVNLALNKGEVYIITNATLGWVEYSSRIFYPNFFKMIDKIKIISARGEWENIFPNDINQWKMKSFSKLRNNFNNKLVTNIICLGDSMLEIEAGRFLANCFKEAFIKTIKFKEEPKPDELNKQLILVKNQFNTIHSSIKSLTVRVEKKRNENK